MASRPTSPRVLEAARNIGEQLTTWRKLLGLKTTQVADRAGIARGTLTKLEKGEAGVSLSAFLSVALALGQLERVIDAVDPYETDLGRARADQVLPQRVRS